MILKTITTTGIPIIQVIIGWCILSLALAIMITFLVKSSDSFNGNIEPYDDKNKN